MKNLKKIVSLALVMILCVSLIPAACAQNDTVSGTTWTLTAIECDYFGRSSASGITAFVMDLVDMGVQLVPNKAWLTMFSVLSLYCGVEFKYNGTFVLTTAGAMLGESCDWLNYSFIGKWRSQGNRVILDVMGLPLYFTVNGSTMSFDFLGLGLSLTKA